MIGPIQNMPCKLCNKSRLARDDVNCVIRIKWGKYIDADLNRIPYGWLCHYCKIAKEQFHNNTNLTGSKLRVRDIQNDEAFKHMHSRFRRQYVFVLKRLKDFQLGRAALHRRET